MCSAGNAGEAVLYEKEEILAGLINEKNALKTSLEVVTNLFEMHFKVMGPSNQCISASKPGTVKTVSYIDACTDTEELLLDMWPLSVLRERCQSISGPAKCSTASLIASNSTAISIPANIKKAESSSASESECATMTTLSVTQEETITSLNGDTGPRSAMIEAGTEKEWKIKPLSVAKEPSTDLVIKQYSGFPQGEPGEENQVLQDSETTLALPPDCIGLPDLHSQDVADAELTLMEDLSNLGAQESSDTRVDASEPDAKTFTSTSVESTDQGLVIEDLFNLGAQKSRDTKVDVSDGNTFTSTSVEPADQDLVMEDLSDSAAQESRDTKESKVDDSDGKAFASISLTSVEPAHHDSGNDANMDHMDEIKAYDDSLDGKIAENVAHQDLDDSDQNLRRSRDQQVAKKRNAQGYLQEDDHDATVPRSPSKDEDC